MLEKAFKLSQHNTTVKTEVMAGITTFMTMAYILAVNPSILSAAGMDATAVLLATALASFVGTACMALLANLPFALSAGMGLNAYLAYTVVIGYGYSWQIALLAVFVEGLIFIVLSLTNVREAIFNAIPLTLKKGVSVGIGLFIAFIGLQNCGLVVKDSSTGVTLTSMNILGKASWATLMPLLIVVLTLIAIAVLASKGIKGAVLYGILGGAALYYLLGLTIPGFFDSISLDSNPLAAFADFGNLSIGKVFTEGFDFSAYLANNSVGNLVLVFITTSLAFCMVDMFDTMGTLYGACARGNLLTEKGEVPRMEKAMFADAAATTVGAICGTSTVTTFVESSAGVAEGGRTGLSSMFTALFFFIAMFLSPVASLIPTYATAAALIYVGVLMMNCVKSIDWLKIDVAVPAFLTIAMMPFTYNISYGIAFGMISYVLIKLFRGEVREIKVTTWIITLLFIAMFLFTH